MKGAFIAVCMAGFLFAVEGQSGSSTTTVAPQFNVVRALKGGRSEPHLRSIRVMTWNVDHGAELDRIATEMKANPVDLCLLQEVDWDTARAGEQDVAAELARRLGLNGSYGIEFEELSQERGKAAYIGQATLTRLPIKSSRVLRFEHQSGFWKPRSWIPSSMPLMQRRLGDRIALVSELEFSGKLLVVYNAHLESRSAGRIQDHQLGEMINDSRRYPSGTAIILGGDLNTKYLPSIFLHQLEANGFRSALGEHIERTHKIAMALDWIFAKGPVRLSNGSVRRNSKGSDHYPVYGTLEPAS